MLQFISKRWWLLCFRTLLSVTQVQNLSKEYQKGLSQLPYPTSSKASGLLVNSGSASNIQI